MVNAILFFFIRSSHRLSASASYVAFEISSYALKSTIHVIGVKNIPVLPIHEVRQKEVDMVKIAICDDEKNIRTYLSALVRRQGTECEITEYAAAEDYFASGQQALIAEGDSTEANVFIEKETGNTTDIIVKPDGSRL